MKSNNFENIDLAKLGPGLARYQNQWIVLSMDTAIVGSGASYGEALEDAERHGGIKPEDVVLFKVPPLDVSFAPSA